MQLSTGMIHSLLAPLLDEGDWQWANEYGEPGYSFKHDATTPVIILGSYWCPCGHNPHEGKQDFRHYGGSNPYYVVKATDLHTYEDHHPRVWKQMEAQGVEFEWSDEWAIDYDYSKAYRTCSDSHGWQPAFVWTDGGDMLTRDDDIAEWVEWAKNKPTRCIPTRIVTREQITDAGWSLMIDKQESGLHQGMDADPQATFDRQLEGWDYLFMLDETSQFYITWSMWGKEAEES